MAGSGNVLDAFVRFLANTKDIDKALDKDIPQKAQASGQKAGTAFGKALTIGGTAGGVLFTSAIQGATQFEDQLRTINTVAKLSDDQLKGVGDSILDLSRETGKSTDDLTAGFYDLVSAGVPAKDAMAVLKDSAILATGALGSTAEAVDLVTSVMGAYGLEAKDSARITDIFAQSVADGKTTAADLAAGISQIAPIAASAGVSIEEIASSAALMTLRGDSASQAFTKMKAAVSALLTPNETLNKIQQSTGKNFLQMLKQGVPLKDVLEELRLATDGNEEAFAKALGSTDALNYALSVTGDNAAESAAELLKIQEGADAGGVALGQYEEAQKSAAAGGRRLTAEIKAFLIEFGEPFVSTFGGAVTALGLMGPAFGSIRIGALAVGGALGGLLTKTIKPLVAGFRELATAGKLGGVLQDVALGRGLRASVVDGLTSLTRYAPVRAAAQAAGKVLGPIFAGAMFASKAIGDAASAGLQTVLTSAPVKKVMEVGGKALGGVYGRAVAIGAALAIPAIVATIAEAVKKPLDDVAKNLHDAIFQGPLEGVGDFFEGVGRAAADLPWPLGPKGAPEWAGGAPDAAAGGEAVGDAYRDGFSEGIGSLDAGGAMTQPLKDAEGPVRAASEELAAALTEPGLGAVKTVNQTNQAIRDSFTRLRSELNAAASGAADALYDPIIKAGQLAETQAELRALKQRLISEDLTASEVAELQKRRAELNKQLILQNADLLTYGTQAEQISKTKAFLASNFWVQAYEDATPEQAAALDAWREELTSHLTDMENDAAQGGDDVREGFVGGLKPGAGEVKSTINTWSSAAQSAFDKAQREARSAGYGTGAAYAAGLRASYGLVNDAAYYIGRGIGPLKPSSPPPAVPWIIDAGKRLGELWADGIKSAVPAVRTASGVLAGGLELPGSATGFVNPSLGTFAGLSAGAQGAAPAAQIGDRTYEYHIHAEGQLKVPDPLAAANLLARFQGTGQLPEGDE